MHTTTTPTSPSPAPVAAARTARSRDVLRPVLAANAATSIAGGYAALVAAGPVAHLLGTGHVDPVRIGGAGLLLFGLAVLALARSAAATRFRLAPAVSIVDAMWVVGTVVALVEGWFSTRGAVVMAAVGLAVADLAIAQIWFARRSAR